MPMNPLREALTMYPEGQDDEFVRLLQEQRQQRPTMPPPPARRPAMPQRQRMGGAAVPAQILGGIGDIFMARGGMRSDYLGRTMGMQQAMEEQNFRDQLAAASQAWEDEQQQEAYKRFAFGEESRAGDREFGRAYKMRELKMLEEMQKKLGGASRQKYALMEKTLPEEFKGVADSSANAKLRLELLKASQGDPEEMEMIEREYQRKLSRLSVEAQTPGWLERSFSGAGSPQSGAAAPHPPLNDYYGLGSLRQSIELQRRAAAEAEQKRLDELMRAYKQKPTPGGQWGGDSLEWWKP